MEQENCERVGRLQVTMRKRDSVITDCGIEVRVQRIATKDGSNRNRKRVLFKQAIFTFYLVITREINLAELFISSKVIPNSKRFNILRLSLKLVNY